eukprot:TRINITY_DN1858_c0_g1_i3.p1 TRINITY_DN1858_c0_g1~~TRINITY_DN1858_c0_g1_i3.p1  ORF type:complete len:310 (-),score=27.35 TRINITY_DN1858_c0_g1_i3:483-1412(-)
MNLKRKRSDKPPNRTTQVGLRKRTTKSKKEKMPCFLGKMEPCTFSSPVQTRTHLDLRNCHQLESKHIRILRNSLIHNLTSVNLEFCNSLIDEDFATLVGVELKDKSRTILGAVIHRIVSSQNYRLFSSTFINFPFTLVFQSAGDSTPPLPLEHINLGSTNVTDAGIRAITHQCPTLNQINLLDCQQITDLSLSYIAEKCTNLQHLNVSGCRIGCYGIQLVSQQTKGYLRSLEMNDCYQITDAIVPYLIYYCPNLVRLGLRFSSFCCYLFSPLCPSVHSIFLPFLLGSDSVMYLPVDFFFLHLFLISFFC